MAEVTNLVKLGRISAVVFVARFLCQGWNVGRGADPVRDGFIPALPRTWLEPPPHWATTEFCIVATNVVVSAFSRLL